MTNKLIGFCIRCGKNIPLDINQPFCKKCYSLFQNLSISSKIEGKYCHYCRRINESINNHIEPEKMQIFLEVIYKINQLISDKKIFKNNYEKTR